ncbi:MAG: hypothetical protein GXO50_01825 [Chlorobi bacterium]|nr:hypothetical protein [Chlorobiota bacterium]
MKDFEKYLSNEFSVIGKILFRVKLELNPELKTQFVQYKEASASLMNMFKISEAEKEIKQNKQLLLADNLIDMFLTTKTNDETIYKFLENAF